MAIKWRPSNVFYGWWIVAATFFIGLYMAGVVYYGFTTIFEPIADELGWSYAQISLAASLRGLEASLLAPVAGILVDRWGPRKLIFGGAILVAMGYFLLSQTHSLVTFYAAFFLIATGMSMTAMTVLTAAVVNWFHKRVGIALGITNSGFGLGGLMIPVIVRLMDEYGWRSAILIVGVGIVLIVIPLSLVVRNKPEHYGYTPDGEIIPSAIDSGNLNAGVEHEKGSTLKKALKGRVFWYLAVGAAVHTMTTATVVTHVMPYLSSINIARSTSSLVASASPLMSIVGRVAFGWFGDRFNKKYMGAISFAMTGIALLLFGYTVSMGTFLLIPFIIFYGIGYGGTGIMRASMGSDYFSRKNFGAVFGFVIGIGWVGGMIGPPIAGWVFDKWGTYQPVWFVLTGIVLIASLLILTIPSVKEKIRTKRLIEV